MSSSDTLPFIGAYWVKPQILLAGPYPSHPNSPEKRALMAEKLVRIGIGVVINLMESDETNREGRPFDPYLPLMAASAAMLGRNGEIRMERYPIRDMDIPDRDTMTRILDRIDGLLDAGEKIYLHCWGGKGRTGMVVGCYLVRHGLATGHTVLQGLAGLRSQAGLTIPVPETGAQREFVRSWPP